MTGRTHMRARSLALSEDRSRRVDVTACGKEFPLYSPLVTAHEDRTTCRDCREEIDIDRQYRVQAQPV